MLGDVEPRDIKPTSMEPVIYRGRDNLIRTTLEQFNGRKFVPLDLSDVTRMILLFETPTGQLVFDSSVIPDVIDWTTVGGGVIDLDLTIYALNTGSYNAQLIAFDAEHPGGQVLIDGHAPSVLTFEVREVYSSGTVPPPLPTGGESVVRSAGEVLSALKVVYELNGQVFVLDQQDGTHIDLLLGITTSAAGSIGDPVVVQTDGTIDDNSWSWSAGTVYLGTNGVPTQVVPTTGWLVVLGSSPSPQRINLAIGEPTQL